MNRRKFLGNSLGIAALFGFSGCASNAMCKSGGVKIGYMYPGNDKTSDIELAREIGFDGIELQTAFNGGAMKAFKDKETMTKFKAAAEKQNMPVRSLCAGFMNSYPFVSDPKAVEYISDTIRAAKYYGAYCILLPFFGKGSLLNENGKFDESKFKPLVERLKQIAPVAAENKIYVCLEGQIDAPTLIRILDAVGSEWIGVYYDTANHHAMGYNVGDEIRSLGGRIKQIHFKDCQGRFNSKNPDIDACIKALHDINYSGWIVLERNFEPDTPIAYWRHNLDYIRKHW